MSGDGHSDNWKRRGSVMFTRSVVSSSSAGSTLMTPNAQPRQAGLSRTDCRLEGAGMAPPASSVASIQAAAASSAPARASSSASTAEKQLDGDRIAHEPFLTVPPAGGSRRPARPQVHFRMRDDGMAGTIAVFEHGV